MKFLRATKSGHVFQLKPLEQHLLLEVLSLYPLVPTTHHRLNKSGDDPQLDENQQLLEESLAEHRRENQRQVLDMLKQPQCLHETESGFELKLTRTQIEWLLQALNDVRVGSWLALGKPEADTVITPDTQQIARYHLAMDVCGMFQSMLLASLGVSESSDWIGD